MAGSIEAQIKPTGISQRHLVDLLYQVVSSIQGICAKLDDDGGVPLTTYEANVYTKIFNGQLEDSNGNLLVNEVAAATSSCDDRFFRISPTGLTNEALTELLYQIFDMMETMTEQLDSDTLTDSTYEALCYTALYTWIIENRKGGSLGNGTTYYIKPGTRNDKELVNLLYQIVNSMETLTEQLDADGTVTDTDYEATWFTATILTRVENSAGKTVGNSPTEI